MLDVGGGSGAFSYVFTEATPGLTSTVLELPEVCKTGEGIKKTMSADVQSRVSFTELDATNPQWPVSDGAYEVVLMSYISGSVPESIIGELYKNAYKALKPGGRLLIHDFMVNDRSIARARRAGWPRRDGQRGRPRLCPKEIIDRTTAAGFSPEPTSWR